MYQIDLSKYLTQEAIVRALTTMPELKTDVMDTIYTARRNHPLALVATDEIQQTVQNIAVVPRGGNHTPIYQGTRDINYIEPQPLKPTEKLNGVDINNLKLLSPDGIEAYVNNKIDRIRQAIRKSTEAMAAQSLTGTISYPMDMGNGSYGTYNVDFGSTLSFTPGKLWTAADITASAVIDQLIAIETLIQGASQYGITLEVWAGRDAFLAICKIVEKAANENRYDAKINGASVTFNGYTIKLQARQYVSDIAAGTKTPIVATDKIVVVAKDAPFDFIYAAVDDLEAGLIGTPLALKQYTDGRSGSIEILAESKPLPIPYTKGICWAKVI